MPGSVAEQIKANVERVESEPWLGMERLWLTFYLCGPPPALKRLALALAERNWVNLDGWEGAFLYPKVEVPRTRADILEAATAAQALCAEHAIEIVAIDADTSPEVKQSQFLTLYRA